MDLSFWEIVGIILIIILFGGVIWRLAKKLLVVAFIAVLILLGIYFTKPEILYDWFGKENVEKVEKKAKEGTQDLKDVTNEVGNKVGKAVDKN